MNEEYSTYLNSEAWQKKRAERLAIGRFRCAACSERRAVHVHHLTYERIFNEDMADLLPLCKLHHDAAEELVKRGSLPRRGDVLFLATETIRLLCATPVIIQRPQKKPSARLSKKERIARRKLKRKRKRESKLLSNKGRGGFSTPKLKWDQRPERQRLWSVHEKISENSFPKIVGRY